MGSLEGTLPLAVGISPLPHWFFLLLPLEQILLEPAVKTTPIFLAKPEAMVMIAQVLLANLTLELVLHWSLSFLLISPPSSYFPSSYDPEQLLS